MKRLVLVAVVLLFLGGGIYIWWTYGDLPVYLQRVINATSKTPEGVITPRYSMLVSHTETSITLKEEGATYTFMLSPGTTVTSRVEAGSLGKYLRELSPETPLLFLVGTSSPDTVEGLYAVEPYAEPARGEEVLDGILSENSGTTFVLLGAGTKKTSVSASGATVYSMVTSGVAGTALSEAPNGQQVRVVGKREQNSFTARIIDLL